jgi:F-type H+-transporting ATPase subunit alpha
MLKQPQYQPMPMEEQVVSIYAATPQETRESWVRHYPVEDVQRYERELLAYMREQHRGVLTAIRESRQLADETRQKLSAALDGFAQIFAPSRAQEAA